MADRRHLIENREARGGSRGADVPTHVPMRQRWGAAVWRAQTQVLLGRLKCVLPGWEAAESRRAADTAAEASWRSHASTPVGLAAVGGLTEIAAGVLGTAATWVASTGSRTAGREAQTPRLVGARERQVRGLGGGARAALLGM
jgi:hypothetical protein